MAVVSAPTSRPAVSCSASKVRFSAPESGAHSPRPTTLQGATINTSYDSKIDWLALATARAGFVVGSSLLLYGKAGVAIAQETHNLTSSFVIPGQGSVAATLSAKPVHTGLVAGVGGEYAFMPNWSVKLEYDYVRMAQQAVVATGTGFINAPPVVGSIENAQLFNKVNQDLHLVKFGVNYHFNPHRWWSRNTEGSQGHHRARAADITSARIRPLIAPLPKRFANASAAASVAASSPGAPRASISLRSGVPWQ